MRPARVAAALLLTAVAPLVAVVGGVSPASAAAPPVIGSTLAVPSTVTTGAQIELEWQFVGDLTGFTSSLQLSGPGGATMPTCAATTPVLVSGWIEAGTLAVTCTVPTAATVGAWTTSVHMVGSGQQTTTAAGPSFTVLHPQTLTFTSTPPAPASASGPTYTVTAESTSGLTVALALDGSSVGCSLAGSVVTFEYAAECIIDATQAGDAAYAPAPPVQQSITVVGPPDLTPPVLTGFTATPPADTAGQSVTIGWSWTTSVGISFTTMVAKGPGGSTLPCNGQSAPVTVGATSGTTQLVCAIPTSAANGTWTIAFELVDTSEHGDTTTVTGFTMDGGPLKAQTVSFTSSAPATIALGHGVYVPVATATSGLAVSIGLDPHSTGCTMAAGVVTFVSPGDCLVDADQTGDLDTAAAPQVQQSITVTYPPATTGSLTAQVVGIAALPDGLGYWITDASGAVSAHGDAVDYGSMAGRPLNSPIAHIVATPDGKGYWLVAGDGGTFAFGDAGFFGSMGGKHLNAPVVDIAPTPDGRGYWLVASDGGIFAFGDATFHGSMGGRPLNRPVVGIAADRHTGGYWEVATDGGIFAFGAPFYGSTGNIVLNRPILAMAPTTTGLGYWFVASDGGIFAFGDARFRGSLGGQALAAPIVGMDSDSGTGGYWMVGGDGSVYSFGAPDLGSH